MREEKIKNIKSLDSVAVWGLIDLRAPRMINLVDITLDRVVSHSRSANRFFLWTNDDDVPLPRNPEHPCPHHQQKEPGATILPQTIPPLAYLARKVK